MSIVPQEVVQCNSRWRKLEIPQRKPQHGFQCLLIVVLLELSIKTTAKIICFFFFRPRGPSVNRAWGCCHGGTINTEMCFGSERKRCESDQQRDTRAPQPNCCRCDIVDVRAVTTTLVVFGHQTCQHLCLHIKSTVVITDTVAALNLTCAFGKFSV